MCLESLPSRRMWSVSVIEGYPGFYEVHGDEEANAIAITISQQEGSFTLGEQTYTNAEYVAVLGYGGDDAISVLSVDGAGMIGAAISGGDGNDTLSLNSDGAIWGGDDDDTITLLDSFAGEAYGEAGNDTVTIGGETVAAEIQGGDGDDVIDATTGNYGLIISGGAGDDTIYGTEYDDVIAGNSGSDLIYGGSGNDDIYTAEIVYGGSGYDIVFGAYVSASDVEEFV